MENRVLYKTEMQREGKEEFRKMIDEFNLPECVVDFFDTVRSINSRSTYWYTLKDFFFWKFDTLYNITEDDIKNLKSSDANRYMDQLIDEDKFSSSTINIRAASLMSFFKYLYIEGIHDKNKAIKLGNYKLKVSNGNKKMPTTQEIKELEKSLSNIKKPLVREKYLLIYNMFKTIGIRLSELVGLDIQDVHINEIDERTGELCSYITCLRKGSYSKPQMEKVYLSDKLVGQIEEWLKSRSYILKTNDCECNALFINDSGKRMSRNTIQNMFSKLSNGNISCHMLRHYASTMMLKKTNDLKFVQEQLGHSEGSSVTMATYVAGLEESRRKMRSI